jgi:hypothetical protein
VDTDVLVRDYLARLEAAAAILPADRGTELVTEVRDHIGTALAEAGGSDEVTVRNVLERLGSPEDIVAAERSSARVPGGAFLARDGAASGSRWGRLEVAAAALLGLAWPALLLPFGVVLWLAFGVVGLVLVWASHAWSGRRKLIITSLVVVLYVVVIVVTTPVTVQCTTGTPPQPCPPGGPSPVITNY